jgi:hypothetical protein
MEFCQSVTSLVNLLPGTRMVALLSSPRGRRFRRDIGRTLNDKDRRCGSMEPRAVGFPKTPAP